jgi:predicted double-glycine peptidase
MATLLTYHLHDPVNEAALLHELLRNRTETDVSSAGGFSLLDLKRLAVARGYVVNGYRDLGPADLNRIAPAIVPLNLPNGGHHFVVVRGLEGAKVVLADPDAGTSTLSAARFGQLWVGGIAMVVENADGSGGGHVYHAGSKDYTAPASPYETLRALDGLRESP